MTIREVEDRENEKVLVLGLKVSLSLFNLGIRILNFVRNERYIRLRVGMVEKFVTEFSQVIFTTKFQTFALHNEFTLSKIL